MQREVRLGEPAGRAAILLGGGFFVVNYTALVTSALFRWTAVVGPALLCLGLAMRLLPGPKVTVPLLREGETGDLSEYIARLVTQAGRLRLALWLAALGAGVWLGTTWHKHLVLASS
jgi:hypothetical protein